MSTVRPIQLGGDQFAFILIDYRKAQATMGGAARRL